MKSNNSVVTCCCGTCGRIWEGDMVAHFIFELIVLPLGGVVAVETPHRNSLEEWP